MARLWEKYKNNDSFLKLSSKLYNMFGNNKCKLKGKKNIIKQNKSFFKKTRIKIEGDNNCIEINPKVRLSGTNFDIKGNNNRIIIHDNCSIHSSDFVVLSNNTTIELNKDTTCGGALFACIEENTQIIIGEDCMLAYKIELRTGDGHNVLDNNTKEKINKGKSIKIGNHVWMGTYVKILKGSVIKDNSVVALGSIVTKPFTECNCIVGGTPAKIIKRNINWTR